MQTTNKYQTRGVDQQRLNNLMEVRPRVNNAIQWYLAQHETGLNRINWKDFYDKDFDTKQNAFGRLFVDKMKNNDMLVATELFRLTESQGWYNFRTIDKDHVAMVEAEIAKGTYNKTTKTTHPHKWRTMMFLLEAAEGVSA